MKKFDGYSIVNKSMTVLLVMVMMVTMFTQVALAEEQLIQEVAPAQDMPSAWAIGDVQMANLHMIGVPENYTQFQKEATFAQLLSIQNSLNEIFDVVSNVESGQIASRQVVIETFYDVIQEVLIKNYKMDVIYKDSREALTYFVEKGLIAGRDSGDYALEQICTNQELLVFARRVYDHLVHAIDIDAKGAFWRVSDEDNTVYLLGSVHVSDASIYPLNEAIIDGYADSEVLAVEANILKQNPEDIAYVQKIMFLEGDTTIDQVLQPETYEAYEEAISSLNYFTPEVYNKFKPWYAALLLQQLQLSNASYSANLGVDISFLSAANMQKPIVELEGAKFQLDMFDGFSDELQEQFLLGVLTGSESQTAEVLSQIINCWRLGDVEGLETLLFGEEAVSEIDKEFVTTMWETRNNNMSEKIEQFLKEDSTNNYFVVVGAGHMLTETGIVQQLINRGYTVEQVK